MNLGKDKLRIEKESQTNRVIKGLASFEHLTTRYMGKRDKAIPKLSKKEKNPKEIMKALEKNISEKCNGRFDKWHHQSKLLLLNMRSKETKKSFIVNRNCQLDEIADQVMRSNRLHTDLSLFPNKKKMIWKEELRRANKMEGQNFAKMTKEFLAKNRDNFFG